MGPIFAFDLIDDFYEQFVLVPHLVIEDCVGEKKNKLVGMMEVRLEDDYVTTEVLTMDGVNLYFMNTELQVKSQFFITNTSFCSSYLQI